MLNSLRSNFNRIKFILDSNKFKAIFLMLVLTCFFNLFNITNGISYEEAIFSSITNTLFLFVLISILFISSCIVIYYFDKDYSILLRYKNKLEYLKNLFISVTMCNLIIYSFAILLCVLLITFKYFGVVTFKKVNHYDIPFLVYNPFTMCKYFIVINILSLLGICVYKNFGKISCYIYYSIILIVYYAFPVSADVISNFNLKNLFFKFYLFPYQYSSFYLELSSSIITICSLLLFVTFVLFITIKFNKIRIND